MADLEGLKAAQEQVIAAINRRDLDGWLALMHDDVIYLNAVASFTVEGKVALRQVAEAQYERCESLNVTLIDTHYRVFERTGIVWGYSVLFIKPQAGSPQTILTRANGVYAKVKQMVADGAASFAQSFAVAEGWRATVGNIEH